ncbi:MAG: hypothetical protein A3F82_07975 [Deltaproteobacteria bacterium RIFCSPLOWO2_12_FULL_44_12]|nr:MAG: hypothetical protein A2712_07295 [Deltaproteobacteria bacterium RIFCSPHIGHO2_01_FULL_43_49]OGQ15749.1 MAG: hypothetical protein A3D22_06085 [Deltaproteobacteria bacterium RIFCSPHIGHO2_02_FULL_44_53]OGQ28718.1 MAG: hypothetical protein A3D98_00820 [Deltaproteobacteria bacterium RIFCSPHIGHO2_12_FULL_44_21]OGQ32042.1 MAG: hypothetical protein A2979_03030 [Deltaproteobacteria bacterium RIFCSPLOWO2_01_FULL_45_74]OGQ43653.1 MAG: hypothetical protein A3I70_03545 [Deltaproteobacteria bacterium 
MHFKFQVPSSRFQVLSFVFFVLLLTSCSGGQSLLPNSQNLFTPSENNSQSNNPSPDGTSNLELGTSDNLIKAIDSPNYKGEIALSLKSFDSVSQLKDRYPTFSFKNQFGDPVLVERERKRLEVVVSKSLPDLRRHLVVAEPNRTKAKELLIKFTKEPLFEMVYPKMKGEAASVTTPPNLLNKQSYLDDLQIRTAWTRGAKGQNTHLDDQEEDWNPAHIDLPQSPYIKSTNSQLPQAIAHGTAVLGILVGKDDGIGVTGIAPQATAESSFGDAAGIASVRNEGTGERFINFIHLLEEQYSNPTYAPCNAPASSDVCVAGEFYPDAFEAYQIATAMGVPVVLPAGNGGINMDTTRYMDNWPNLSRQDSGAIMVGASMGANRQKASFSNCGQRINLFAWGSGVVTTSYPGAGLDWFGPDNPNNGDPNAHYTNAFGGTSSAAAIIAGTVSLLQSYASTRMGTYKYLSPEKVREILIQSGVPAEGENGCNIGKQPRMNVALNIFDDYWAGIQRDFPEIANGTEIKGDRRRTLRQRGVGLVCNYHRPDLSDPNCPETAKCVLVPPAQRGPRNIPDPTVNPSDCAGGVKPACIAIDFTKSDYDCAAGAIWPTGIEIAKTLDFDGDQKADLVNWTNNKWQIDLSSIDEHGTSNLEPGTSNLGTWNLELRTPAVSGKWVWPVAEDYNSDGRVDLAVYDKEHGVWYIKFTNNELLRTQNSELRTFNWDWQITLDYHDELNRDVWQAKYGRPVPGDYNGDGYIDLAIARSDGIWSIDFGGPNRTDYGTFDLNVTYLTPAELAAAPGWAYLPIVGNLVYGGGSSTRDGEFDEVTIKFPDGIVDVGKVVSLIGDSGSQFQYAVSINDAPYGGNESIPLVMNGIDLSFKSSSGSWPVAGDRDSYNLSMIAPAEGYGGLECHPVIADFDGDNKDDRAVQCPTEFRIGLSSTGQLRKIVLGYNTQEFSLPGKPYFGGISYMTVQRLIEYQLINSTQAPIIPVDMVSIH